MISVALPYHDDRYAAVSVDVRETTVDWYLAGLASTLAATVALLDEQGLPLLVHTPDGMLESPDDTAIVIPDDGAVEFHDGAALAGAPVPGTPWRLAVAIDQQQLQGTGTQDAQLPWVLVGFIVLSAAGGAVLIVRLDTVRRRASEIEAEYRRTIDHLQEGVIRTSLRGELQLANRAALRLLGMDDVASAPGYPGGDVTAVLAPEQASDLRERLTRDGSVNSHLLEIVHPRPAGARASYVSLSAQVVNDETGRPCAVEGLLIDVTERHRAEQELHRRDLILESAATAASMLLRETDWERAISQTLATMGAGAGVERVFLFGVTPCADEVIADYLHEWVGVGVPPAIDAPEMHDIPMRAAGFARWIEALSTGRTVIGDAASFPNSEQALLQAVSARSLLVAPVQTRHGWWGFLGFAEVTTERAFSAAEEDAVRLAAGVNGAAIDRTSDHARLQDAVAEQARTAEALRVAGQVRDDFLSMVSHELRTPLTPILGFAHVLERPELSELHRGQAASAVRRNARRMLGLVDDLLVYSRRPREPSAPSRARSTSPRSCSRCWPISASRTTSRSRSIRRRSRGPTRRTLATSSPTWSPTRSSTARLPSRSRLVLATADSDSGSATTVMASRRPSCLTSSTGSAKPAPGIDARPVGRGSDSRSSRCWVTRTGLTSDTTRTSRVEHVSRSCSRCLLRLRYPGIDEPTSARTRASRATHQQRRAGRGCRTSDEPHNLSEDGPTVC
jgi:PAS domain S-box-containing protein